MRNQQTPTNIQEHLLFCNRIREAQPGKQLLPEYFSRRHWGSSHWDWEKLIATGSAGP